MKKVALAKSIAVALLILFTSLQGLAQQVFKTTTTGSIIGYLEYLPQDYSSNSDKYPVVIFLHGADERGAVSTDPAVLQTTISLVSKLGPPEKVKNGAQFPFILISPQLKTSYGSWPASYVKEVIDHCKTYLRIDERRIHVTGLSMGGHGTWTCIESMPSLYASAAPVCGANNTPSKACLIASENVAVWAFHGDADPVVSYTKTTNMVNAINACVPAPTPLAKATIYAGIQHNAWYRAYYLDNNYHNPNYYQWLMLQTRSKRGTNYIPVANAGGDKSIALPTSSVIISGSATDNGGSISSYSWTQLQGPSTATLSGATSATLTASNLVNGTYVFKFTVTDNGGLIDSDFVKVTVTGTGSNAPPVVSAGTDKTITLPANSTSLAGTATDSDGSIASYNWTKVSGGSATLSGNTTANLSVSGMVAGTYVFRLMATDDKGASNTDDVSVMVNNPPTVSAGSDVNITLPTNSVSVQGTASDPDGTITSYTWTKTTGGSATLSGATTSRLTASGMAAGSYVFRLTVKDNLGASKYDDVSVTVNSSGVSNILPVADAGNDRLITLPTSAVTITGIGSDADGTISAYNWSKISGGAATLSGTTTTTLSASALAAGTYVFRLTITDNAGGTDTDDVTVTVNNPPSVSAGSDFSITLPTNSTSIQGTASDTDGTIATYSWQMTTGTVATLSGTTTSRLTASGLIEGPYVFRLTVTDNKGASKFDDVKVTVLPDPDPNTAPVADAGEDQLLTLPSNSVVITGNGTDADGTVTTYSWSKISGGSATLSGTSSNTLSASALVAGSYIFRLTVTDNDGSTDSDDVNVIVNSPPNVSVGADYSLTLPTNSTSIQGTVSDPDGTVVSYLWKMTTGTIATLSGTTTSKLTASGLVEGPYVFRLIVTDDRGATKFDDVKITVKSSGSGSTTPNVPPVADAGSDRLITLPSNSVSINGVGTDSDGTIASYAWSKVSGGAATLTGATTSVLTASGLVSGVYVFRLTVTDNSGGTDTDDVSIEVNAPPVVSAGADFSITLPTNSLSVQGTSSDDGTIVSYLWKMTTGVVATLSGTTTSKLTATNLIEGPYVFRLTVTDNHGVTKFDDVKITVKPNPNNIAPVADAGADQLITLPTSSVSVTGSGSDSDGSYLAYAWTKVSGGAATLAGTNTSSLTASGLVGGSYVFRLTVTDNNGATDYDDVTVIVNQPPVVSVGADYNLILPANSTSVQGVASDPDGTIASYQWQMTTGTVATLSGTTTSKLTATGLIEGSYVFRLHVTDNNGAKKFDDIKIVVKSSSAAALSAEAIVVADPSLLEDDDETGDLSYENDNYWKDKKVVIYDATGRQTFSGRWSPSDFHSLIESGKLYIFNVMDNGRKIRQGKIFVVSR
jgi:predicted secreted protein